MPSEGRPAIEHTVPAQTRGRYLVSPGPGPDAPLVVGFHGYGETVEEQLARLCAIPSSDRWTLISVQGLHQFYRRRTNEVVGSWMTRQNRELAIEDNIAYVAGILETVCKEHRNNPTIVLTGFSQGVAMTFRTAASSGLPVAGVISCGGDVPPELHASQLQRIPATLIGRGIRDEWYTAEKLASDEHRLRQAGVSVQSVVLDAGHEWTSSFSEMSGEFLKNLLRT